MKRPESVLVVVHNQRGEVLLMRRGDVQSFWQSVTGSLEWEETPGQAARREVEEETGLQASASELRDRRECRRFPIVPPWTARYPPGVTENLEHVFTLEVADQPPIRLNPGEHLEYRWLPRERAADLVTSHTNREAILRWVPVAGESR